MADTDLIIERSNIANARLIEPLSPDAELAAGQVMVTVERFGLTSNNLSYAATGDILGYWSFFPAPDPTWGRLPVWGYAHVTRSEHPDLAVGEQLFGIFPAAARLIIEPTDVSAISLSDSYEHRTPPCTLGTTATTAPLQIRSPPLASRICSRSCGHCS